jgi:hypothetical protein
MQEEKKGKKEKAKQSGLKNSGQQSILLSHHRWILRSSCPSFQSVLELLNDRVQEVLASRHQFPVL